MMAKAKETKIEEVKAEEAVAEVKTEEAAKEPETTKAEPTLAMKKLTALKEYADKVKITGLQYLHHIFIDEFHIVFENEYSASFFNSAWRQFRKRDGFPTGITL